MGAALPPLVTRQQPAQDTPLDLGNRYGGLATALFPFNRSFRSATRRSGNPNVSSGGPSIQVGPNGFYAAGNGSGNVVTDFLPSDIGFAGATARTFVVDFYMGDTNGQKAIFSLGDSSGNARSQYTLLNTTDYRKISLQTYGTDLDYSPYSTTGTGARVFLMGAYDGNVTVVLTSIARVDSTNQITFNSQTYTLPAPLATGNTVPLTLMGGGTYGFSSLQSPLDYAAFFGGSCFTLADFYALYANRWQVFQKPRMQGLARRQALMPTAAAAPAAALAGTAQAVATASGTLSSAIRLSGAAQAVASASGSLSSAIQLAGNAAAISSATGSLSTAIALAGAAQVIASATGTMAGSGAALAGSAIASASATGNLTTAIRLSGAAQVVASAYGTFNGQGASLAGAAQVVATASGSLTSAIPLAGAAQGRASASGSLTSAIALAGAAQVLSTASGTLSSTGSSTGVGGNSSSNAAKPVTYSARSVEAAHIVVFAGGTKTVKFNGGTRVVSLG